MQWPSAFQARVAMAGMKPIDRGTAELELLGKGSRGERVCRRAINLIDKRRRARHA
jgi:hypothetical protein